MAYKITDSCVACGSCIGECPVEAISAGDIYVIDADQMYRLRNLRRRMPERGNRFGVTRNIRKRSTLRQRGVLFAV